jgi:replication factor A2
VNEQATFTKFDVEDSTGSMEVKLWVDSGDDDVLAERRSACVAGKYVRIIGSLRVFNDSKHIIAHDMRPVVDHNEVTHHFLEVIHQHCQLTKSVSFQLS